MSSQGSFRVKVGKKFDDSSSMGSYIVKGSQKDAKFDDETS
jgi:hypothetical protein